MKRILRAMLRKLKPETQDTMDEMVNTEHIARAMQNCIEEKCAISQRQSPFA